MSQFFTLIGDATRELAARKLRTFLTLLGMIFGVGAVVAMLNIGKGAEKEALELIDSLGVNNIIVTSKYYEKDELAEVREESLGLNMGDIEAALATLPFVQNYSASKKVDSYSVYSDFAKSDASVWGVTISYFGHANLSLSAGRVISEADEKRLAQVAVLGADVASELFPHKALDEVIGMFVKVNHVWLRVIGVLAPPKNNKSEFQGIQVGGDRYRIFVPISTSVNKFSSNTLASQFDSVKLNVVKGIDPIVSAKAIDSLLSMRHGGQNDYQLVIPAALLEQQKQTQQIFNIVMASIAGISLLVGGVGIMNIMLANVLERTKEIGLLRAVGATKRDIRLQFMAESFTISIIGGKFGILFGLALSEVVGFYSGWAVSWSLSAVFLSASLCIITGMAFGVFPALKASNLNPIDALHSD